MNPLPYLDLAILVHSCQPRKVTRSTRALAAAVGPEWSGRLVLVENAPRTATAAAARAAMVHGFPSADRRIVHCRRNLGFGSGVDLGVLECRRPFVGFFNPDGTVEPNAPFELVRALEADDEAVAAGPGGPPQRDWLPGTALVVRR